MLVYRAYVNVDLVLHLLGRMGANIDEKNPFLNIVTYTGLDCDTHPVACKTAPNSAGEINSRILILSADETKYLQMTEDYFHIIAPER